MSALEITLHELHCYGMSTIVYAVMTKLTYSRSLCSARHYHKQLGL